MAKDATQRMQHGGRGNVARAGSRASSRFLCYWCSYTGADNAGTARLKYPPNVDIIRVMCSGRIDPELITTAFARGADGVMVCGCHIGDCHYISGNHKTMARMPLLKRALVELGIEPERFVHEWVSAAEGEKFARAGAARSPSRCAAWGRSTGRGGCGSGGRARHGPAPWGEVSHEYEEPADRQTAKLKIGMYWAASCGGCDISLLEIGPHMLELIEVADVVFWPCAADFKYEDVAGYPDGYMDVCFFNGGVRSSEQEEIARLLRAEEQDPGRLRRVRLRRRHSRPGQPQDGGGDLRRLLSRQPVPRQPGARGAAADHRMRVR